MGTTVGLMLLLLSSRGMVRSQKVIFLPVAWVFNQKNMCLVSNCVDVVI